MKECRSCHGPLGWAADKCPRCGQPTLNWWISRWTSVAVWGGLTLIVIIAFRSSGH